MEGAKDPAAAPADRVTAKSAADQEAGHAASAGEPHSSGAGKKDAAGPTEDRELPWPEGRATLRDHELVNADGKVVCWYRNKSRTKGQKPGRWPDVVEKRDWVQSQSG